MGLRLSHGALAVALARRRGGRWTVTMTPDTAAWLLHAARVVTVVHGCEIRASALQAEVARPRHEGSRNRLIDTGPTEVRVARTFERSRSLAHEPSAGRSRPGLLSRCSAIGI